MRVTDAAVEGAAVTVEVDPQKVRVEELVADGTGAALLVSGAREVLVPEPRRFEGAVTGVTLVADRRPPQRVCQNTDTSGERFSRQQK